ncbi:MAG: hypothetical protein JW864_07890 [Spirochaetes bacterium]|nr:hypothetical protein [Spirochaetota bacterium]
MKAKLPLIVKISLCFILIGAISLFASAITKSLNSETRFTGSLLKFIDANTRRKEEQKITYTVNQKNIRQDYPFAYQEGDWNTYVIKPKYSFREGESEQDVYLQSSDEVNMNAYGSYFFDMLYGNSKFTKDKYKQSDDDTPASLVIEEDLTFERRLQLHMEGNVGRRMTVYIDHDSEKEDNHYLMKYKAVNDDEVIREINAGEIDIKFEESKYAVYDDTSSKGLGLDITLKKDKFKLKAFGSIIKGETKIETFRGNSTSGNNKLNDYQYVKNTYYQLEPYKRYDGLTSPPDAADNPYETLVTFTSSPANPKFYAPENVNISSSGFKLYLDDQNAYNNLNSMQLKIDGGYYDLQVSGSDYIINYSTGLITLLKAIPANSRIFAVYSLSSGSNSSDPATITDTEQFNGKIFVFLKYDYSINEDQNGNFDLEEETEDTNKDKRLNLDVYEVRSVYAIGESQLLEDNFSIKFSKENGTMTSDDVSRLGKYSIDYSSGLIKFNLREPFRQQYKQSIADIIYSENPPSSVYNNSLYNIKIDYYREARSFQLKHSNIIPGSIRVKVNSRVLETSLYTVDYTSGFLQFTDPNNPVIGTDTGIEIKYDYLPFGGQTSSLVTGVRADYQLNRNLNIGSSVLFMREGGSDVIPDAGSEPEQTLLLETDASLHMGEKTISKLVKTISGVNAKTPLEINAYAEYAKSFKKVNTFGKALIDDMSSNESLFSLPVSEKEWVLSSMPYNVSPGDLSNNDRGLLYYHYYRDTDDSTTLHGINYTPVDIDYSKKPGPFNIATGHIEDSIQDIDTQTSLGFDFNFTDGDYVPVVTRELAAEAVDFSGLNYIEIWYKSAGGSGEVELFLDIGSLNEDSDDDSFLDTEDENSNGYLDFATSSSESEDVGYEFNPSGSSRTTVGSGPGLNSYTTGDGVLNTEDLNRNGTLDTDESRIRFPGELTTPYNSSNNVVIDMADTAWRKARIYLNKSSSDYQSNSSYYNELLKEVSSVRLVLKKRGTTNTGTIYIDSIKFVSAIWGNIMLDDVITNSPNEFNLTLVDSINDEEYRNNSFLLAEKDNYISLYGDRTSDELNSEKETAMQIEYNLASRQNGSVTKKFTEPIDIRHYKTMNMWFNFRSFTSGDYIHVIIGSSEEDYITYEFPMDYEDVWREITLRLTDSSNGNIEKNEELSEGSPDFKRISFIRVEIWGQASGRLWLNDIYLSEAKTLTDSAHWYEGEIKYKRPVYITDSGTPVFSDLSLKYIRKGHGSEFSTIGKSVSDISEEYNELFSSMNILPNWNATIDYIIENSETDSLNDEVPEEKRGVSEKRTLLFESVYTSGTNAVPSIKVLYKQNSFENVKEENTSGDLIKKTNYVTHVPSLIVEERLNEFLWGSMVCTVKLDFLFKDEDINRNAEEDYTEEVIYYEKEKRQKNYADLAIDYQNLFFMIKPSANVSSHEIVEAKGKEDLTDTELLSDVNGSFHFPLVYNKDFRFVERDKKGKLKLGLNPEFTVSPIIDMEFYYSEENFRDYSDEEKTLSGNFTRSKSANSSVTNTLNFPFNFTGYKHLSFIKSISISYSRSILFEETDLPYEGEETDSLDEKYGIKNVYNEFYGPAFNLYKYPPWYFFTGRGNFARGRDFTYNTQNEQLTDDEDSPLQIYSNDLRLIENAAINSMFDFEIFSLFTDAGINQVTERQSIYGIPQEVVSLTAGCDLSFDLMQIFSFGFFRPNRIGSPYHAANMTLGYSFTRDMLITSNIEENLHSPSAALTFKRDRKSLSLKGSLNYRKRNKREYISLDDSLRSSKDDIYISNLQTTESFRETDKGFEFSVLFETDVMWIHRFFSYIYKLTAAPIYSIEYSLILNRYDYSTTASPEPYDQHLITSKLTLDLHKNIQGGLTARWALEKFRNRDTDSINREIISYEIGVNFSLLF